MFDSDNTERRTIYTKTRNNGSMEKALPKSASLGELLIKHPRPPSKERAWVQTQLAGLKKIESLPKLQDLNKKWGYSVSRESAMNNARQLIDFDQSWKFAKDRLVDLSP